MPNNNQGSSNRGFAAMDEEKQRDIASKGGQAAQASGHAHQLTDEERRRGGQNSGGNFANRPTEEVQAIGRKGGEARGKSDGGRGREEDSNTEENR